MQNIMCLKSHIPPNNTTLFEQDWKVTSVALLFTYNKLYVNISIETY